MKKLLYTLLLTAILLPAIGQESGIRFFNGSWDEAIILAKKEKKKIFIDFYTEWCGPCLTMGLTVFQLPQVGEVYNKSFVCLKIDAEKGEGRELAKRYGVHSFPTYAFIDPENQELIHRSGGNKPAADFIADTRGALNPKLSSIYLAEKYKSGKYDMFFLMDYIYNRKTSGNRDVLKDFNQLIDMGGKLTDSAVWQLFSECVEGYQNPYIKQVSDNYAQFVELFGKKAVDMKLAEATSYAPPTFLQGLCDFEGKDYNLKTVALSQLLRNQSADAWKMVDELIADTTIDQIKFVKYLYFFVRIDPEYRDSDLSFEQLVKKIRYAKYVAYNMYDREEAQAHYNYAAALEYLIKRSLQENKPIPTDIIEAPAYGKQSYDMRHPQLKQKPGYKRK